MTVPIDRVNRLMAEIELSTDHPEAKEDAGGLMVKASLLKNGSGGSLKIEVTILADEVYHNLEGKSVFAQDSYHGVLKGGGVYLTQDPKNKFLLTATINGLMEREVSYGIYLK